MSYEGSGDACLKSSVYIQHLTEEICVHVLCLVYFLMSTHSHVVLNFVFKKKNYFLTVLAFTNFKCLQ